MSLAAIAGKLVNAITGDKDRPVLEDASGIQVMLDVVTEQTQDSNSVVTRHAVEYSEKFQLAQVTDNTKPDPDNLILKAVLSNHTGVSALNPASYGRALAGTLGNLTGGLISAEDTIQPRIDQLRAWKDKGRLLTYQSKKRKFSDAVISKISDTHSAQTGDGLAVTINLTKITIANAATVTIDVKKPKAAKKTKKTNKSVAKKLSAFLTN